MTTNNVVNNGSLYSAGDGKILISRASGQAIPENLTAGTGITITNATNSITVSTTSTSINTQTISYTLVLTDAGKIVEMNNAGANTLTIPTNASVAFPIGTIIDIVQYGAGKTTVAGAGGVTVDSQGGNLSIAAQYAGATLYKRATDEWVLVGNLIA